MIVGRDREKKQLAKLHKSKIAEFVVVYGRRRVGKTYLIREFFSKKKCLFMHVTGIDKGDLHIQLAKFSEAISKTFFNSAPLEVPTSWDVAFALVHRQISDNGHEKIVIFLDELPWLASKRSNLLQTIDYYWNHHWAKLKNVVFIVCGSSASWMINNIIYDKGGLHNRASCEICLLPFTLSETQAFLKFCNIKLNNRHVLALYMALGGIPYYLKYVEPGLTAEQNIQQIIFDDNAPLKDEFNKLFQSLFNNAAVYIELVKLLAKNRSGMSRAAIQAQAKLSTNGGRLTARLNDLCRAGFTEEYIPWQKKNGEYYKVIDEFCLFYLYWVGSKRRKRFMPHHWLEQSRSQSYKSWAGYAFEGICFKHIHQVIAALGIKSGGTIDSWRFIPRKTTARKSIAKDLTVPDPEGGAQIDLLIDRNDNAITICEIKYTDKTFVIDKAYATQLKNKLAIFKEKTKTNKQIFLCLISANGVRKNRYFIDLIQSTVTLDDLFIAEQ